MTPNDLQINQFRDQLLAHLRDAARPLTTRDIALHHRVRQLEQWSTREPLPARIGETHRGHTVISCEGPDANGTIQYLVATPAPARTIHHDLQALADAGLIQRLNANPATTYWAYLPNPRNITATDLDQLEAHYRVPYRLATFRRAGHRRKDR